MAEKRVLVYNLTMMEKRIKPNNDGKKSFGIKNINLSLKNVREKGFGILLSLSHFPVFLDTHTFTYLVNNMYIVK